MKRSIRFLLLVTAILGNISYAWAFSGGAGTSGDPYLVSTATDLDSVRYHLTSCFEQTQDIDISSFSNWSKIGTGTAAGTYFAGIYNGKGFKITGLTMTGTSSSYSGLFGVIGPGGTVKNLGVTGASLTGGANPGYGILAGYNYGGTVQYCFTTGSVTTSNNNAGGLLGTSSGTVTNCYSTATVSATGTSSMNIGGLIGNTATASSSVSQCYATGNVSNSSTNTSGTLSTGGFIGVAVSTVSDCYSTGNVTCSSASYAGGFIGKTGAAGAITHTYTNCYSTGHVISTNPGGFLGYYLSASVSGNHFDTQTSETTNAIGGSGATPPTGGIDGHATSVMKTASTYSGWSTSTWYLVNGSYPILQWQIPATTTFTGAGYWSDIAHWSNGLPGTTTTATISGNCTMDASYTVAALTITSGYALHIDPGHILTVTGTLTNNAGITGLILESDATGTGMLMNNSTGVQATVRQYLKKYQWHLMGIPVTYVPDVNTVFHGCYMIWMDESFAYSGLSNGWQYLVAGDSMIAMGGYAVRYGWDGALYPKTADTTVSFTGVLNTGVQDTIFDSETEGWNLISNPYPVTMDWDAPDGKSLTNSNDAFYIWNPNLNGGAGDYGSYGSYISGGSTNGQTRYIPPMQGFFFEVWATVAGISFSNAIKAAVSSAVFCDAGKLPGNETKPQGVETAASGTGSGEPSVRLAVTTNGINYDETLIRGNDKATDHFDGSFDAVKLKAIESKMSQIYTVTNGAEYSINTIPEIADKTVIPIRVMVNETGLQHIVLQELKNIPLNTPLTLYDQEGNVLTQFSEAKYSFEGVRGETRSFYLGLGHVNPDDIVALHKSVNESLDQFAQVIVRPAGQGAFAVRKHQTGTTGNSTKSSIR